MREIELDLLLEQLCMADYKCTKCLQDKAATDYYNDKRAKSGKLSVCIKCISTRHKNHYIKNKQKIRTAVNNYKRNNSKKCSEQLKNWVVNNRESSRRIKYRWYKDNIQASKVCTVKWAKTNADKKRNTCARRRATKLKATPSWANNFFIEEIYDLAKLREKHTGIKWHVDHIVPLKNSLVCGLHVEYNMQVIPAKDNLSKGNRFWPDMP